MTNSVKDLVQDMDDEIGSIGAKIESLQDVETAFGQLRESMDTAVYNGQQMLWYQEHHRKVRMLSELLRYLVDDLEKVFLNAEKIHSALFKQVVKTAQHETELR